jgi:hypothetical protein
MGKSLSQKEFILACEAVHASVYDYSKTVFAGAKEKITVGCKLHGDFEQRAHSHMSGMGCRKCAASAKTVGLHYSTKEFVSKLRDVHGSRYSYKNVVFQGVQKSITVGCRLHGAFEQRASSHLSGQGCPMCANESRKTKNTLELETFLKKARKAHGDLYDYSKVVYVHSNKKVKIVCKKHGVFEQTPANHINQRNGCHFCGVEKSKQPSGLEKAVAKWVAKHTPVERNNRTQLSPKEIDVWCPEKLVGIEVHGSYWHREDSKGSKYHYEKALMAKRKGLTLLQFWDWELHEKSAICKSMIASHLNVNQRIGARKCSIQKLGSKEQRTFFDENHLQGYSSATVCYALVMDGVAVAAMSFRQPRFTDEYQWEIIRYANKLNTSVVGGASRLWSSFLKEYSPSSVLSYADLRYSQGALYKTLGFKFLRRSAPSYFYFRAGKRLSRFAAQKSKLVKVLGSKFDPSLSERDNMRNNNWVRVFDAGTLAFVWKEQ